LIERTDFHVGVIGSMQFIGAGAIRTTQAKQIVIPAHAGILHAAAYRFDHQRLRNTWSPGPGSAKASPRLSHAGAPEL
jgi:hypothetical protein